MKTILALLAGALSCMIVSAQGNQSAISVPINSSGSQTYQALIHKPDDYNTTSTKYPLLIFLHGTGESGYNLGNIYNNSSAGGPAYFIAKNQWPSSFTDPVTGQSFKFIVVSPQSPGWSTSSTQLMYIINNLVNTYRVDINRIYLTGLSAGGEGVVGYAVHQELETGGAINPLYKPAAIVPMSAAISNPPQSFGNTIIADQVKPWGFGSVPADIHGEFTYQLINRVNDAQQGYGKFTNYSGGHCCWNTFYNPSYMENVNGKYMSIYEWMLQYSRGGTPPPPSNQPPVANAGPDQIINLPANSINLSGSGSDPDGSIISYSWSKISGPSLFNISNAASQSTIINGLQAGSYIFRLTVTDNKGATGYDDVTIQVNAAITTNTIKTIPGKTEAEVYDAMSGVLTENTTDAGGGINVGWIDDGDWMDYNVTVNNSGSYTVSFRVASLNGNGQLQLKKGATILATVNVPKTGNWQSWQTITTTVPLQAGNQTLRIYSLKGGWNLNWIDYTLTQNQPPVANAGTNITISLPANSINLSGTGTDADGTVTNYNWTKVSGPAQFTFSNPNISNPSVTNLAAGTYIFRLTVTDNAGATGTDDITVQVNSNTSAPGKNIPGKMEAEDYDAMSGIQTENTTDAGGGVNVGWIDDGDWMDYNVTVNNPGDYIVSFRVASFYGGSQLQLKKNSTVLTTLDIPKTGDWQSWQTISATVNLQAGTQTLRIYSAKGGWNINWFNFDQTQQPTTPDKFINVNVHLTSPYNNSEWNNWNVGYSGSNINSPALNYSDGTASGINSVLSQSDGIGDNGSNYNGALATAEVLRQTSYTTGSRTLTINGLSSGKTYSLDLFASRNINPGNSTVYTINGNSITVSSYNNLGNKASFTNLAADAQGKITVGIKSLNTYNYLNGFTLTEMGGSNLVVQSKQANNEPGNSLALLPDEITGRFGIEVKTEATGIMHIQVTDTAGKLQKEYNMPKVAAGTLIVHLSAENLAPGEYTVKVEIGEWSSSVQFSKK